MSAEVPRGGRLRPAVLQTCCRRGARVRGATRTCDDDSVPNSQSAPHALLTLGTKSARAAHSLPNLETQHSKANGAEATRLAHPPAQPARCAPHTPRLVGRLPPHAHAARRPSPPVRRSARPRARDSRAALLGRVGRVRAARPHPASAGSAPPPYRWPCATRCRSRCGRPRGLFSAWRCCTAWCRHRADAPLPAFPLRYGVAAWRCVVARRSTGLSPPTRRPSSPLPPSAAYAAARRACGQSLHIVLFRGAARSWFPFPSPTRPHSPFRSLVVAAIAQRTVGWWHWGIAAAAVARGVHG